MGACLSAVDNAVNDFIDKESRYYKESNNAKDYAKNEQNSGSHAAAVLSSELSPVYPSLPKGAQQFHCKNVYDGDTLTLANGDRVRLLGIDTPELKEKQAFALEAKDDNNKDHYGRLLAFIWVPMNGKQWLCINEGLVATGLAHAYSPSKSKKIHNYDKMLALQKMARKHKKGQWKSYKDCSVIVTPNGSAFHKCKRKARQRVIVNIYLVQSI
ncbi:staphylococcal nuclease domain-containing protein [Skeletonema marinoi]|uniref:Staphylococcal nuclease domain-containing protein n=1 Tax=Skeletonema marinoi TaxID=267567 RepID=A0AAD9D6F7_9STRA|nr:staphylococcal nuclease domain-containing protein [Skeletonema marinoi]